MSIFTGPMNCHLDGHKELTAHSALVDLPEPDIIWISLVTSRVACTPLVNVGDEVCVGTKIAERNDHFYVPLYSPISGKVVAIEKKLNTAMVQCDHIKIENDHKHTKVQAFAPMNYETATREELVDFVKNAGILGLGGAGFPSYVKYAKPDNVDLLIINGVECEPYLTADYRNALDNPELLKTGVLALFKLSEAKKVCFAIKENKKDLIAKLHELFAGTPVEVRTVKDIYPAGWERTLIYMLTKKRYDRLPIEAGCIVNNSSTAIALGDALLNGNPITHKTLTVSGDGIQNPQNVRAVVGTMASEIVAACGGYVGEKGVIIAGGPMMGKALPNDTFTIGYENNGLTILQTREEFSVKCLRCGKCTEHCPSGLQPVRINQCEKAKDVDSLKKLDVMSCIECGLCTYVCPSKLDVTEGVRRAKKYMALVKK